MPAKHTNTPKKTMQIFVIKLMIFLTWSQIDSSLFDRVRMMKIFRMLTKIYRYKEVALYLNIKRFLWVWSCYLLDEYVIWQGSGIEFKEILWKTPSQKIQHFCYYGFFLTVYLSYVASIYVMYLCSIIFQGIHNENDQYKRSDAVRIIKSGNLQ